ncbi:signal transduction histidine kinase [Thermolongibacillus altinsuensis]|uniref:histidine kinase n=1 Tax=Thermolongibacillus altinsuensis TaxID=575256 RepID=A0A4R1QFK4_9BACL|nr:ATP-binding protein [Thermolongibacillus altinsuensis]TCL49246.1 signal transduction histidine kinase [Thermolongibacillus altinsuensis]
MKRIKALSLQKKLWLTISLFLGAAVLFSYMMIVYIYENIYIANIEQNLLSEGMNLAKQYEGGPIDESFKQKVEWLSEISNAEIVLVNNPRELSACLPFEIDHHSIINEKEREQLLEGKTITKKGYEQTFARNILGIIIPLLDKHRLMGILYLYIPLASIEEVFQQIQIFVLSGGAIFLFVTVFVGRKIIIHLTNPLKHMEHVAYKVSQGDFSEKVAVFTEDEIGQLAKAFNQMSSALAEEDQRKKEFLANVSHELRTPLSYVKGYSEALLDGVVREEEQKQKYLKLIHREASRMQRLVRDLLDLAQLEGTYPLHQTPFSIAQLAEETIEKYEPFLHEKNIHIEMNVDHDLIVVGDPDRIEQVLQNLIDNALRYTEDGGTIRLEIAEKQGKCQMVIADTGKGISPHDLERLGERFFRADRSRSREHGGTGLGLAIVKQIIKLHNGSIHFESELGKGTTVSILLPLYQEIR